MSFQSTNIWIKWYNYVWDVVFGIVAFCGLMVFISLIYNVSLIIKKKQVFVVNKLSLIFFISMPIIIAVLLILELWWRINAFYSVSTFYVSYWWQYLLFSGVNYAVILIAWFIKNLYTKRFKEYKKEIISIKNSIFMFFKKIFNFTYKYTKKIGSKTLFAFKWIFRSIHDGIKKIVHIVLYLPTYIKKLFQKKLYAFRSLFIKNKTMETKVEDVIKSPIKGKIITLKQINDKAFADEHLGQGFAVISPPKKVIFRAPVSGVITNIFHTNHAYTIKTKNGNNVLVHIGLNTVQLQGKYYKAMQKIGTQVKVGKPIIKANLKKIKAAGYDITTPVVCTPESKGKVNIKNKIFDKQTNITSIIMKIN